MKRTIHEIALRRFDEGDADSMEEAVKQARKQVKAMQKLTDQAQKLNLGYGIQRNSED